MNLQYFIWLFISIIAYSIITLFTSIIVIIISHQPVESPGSTKNYIWYIQYDPIVKITF